MLRPITWAIIYTVMALNSLVFWIIYLYLGTPSLEDGVLFVIAMAVAVYELDKDAKQRKKNNGS